MKNRAITGAAIGLLTGIPWLIFSFAGEQIARLPVVPFNLFEIFTRFLPGGVVTSGIELMVQSLNAIRLGPTAAMGKRVEMAMAFLLALIILVLLGSLYALSLSRARGSWPWKGILAGLALWALSLPVIAWGGWGNPGALPSVLWVLVLSLAWGVEHAISALEGEVDTGRGRLLAQIAAGSLRVKV